MFFRDLVSKNNNFFLKRVKITTEEFLTSKANALTKVFFFFFFPEYLFIVICFYFKIGNMNALKS